MFWDSKATRFKKTLTMCFQHVASAVACLGSGVSVGAFTQGSSKGCFKRKVSKSLLTSAIRSPVFGCPYLPPHRKGQLSFNTDQNMALKEAGAVWHRMLWRRTPTKALLSRRSRGQWDLECLLLRRDLDQATLGKESSCISKGGKTIQIQMF